MRLKVAVSPRQRQPRWCQLRACLDKQKDDSDLAIHNEPLLRGHGNNRAGSLKSFHSRLILVSTLDSALFCRQLS